MHKVKDKVTREVARMYKDLEFSVRADDWDKYPGFLRLPLEFIGRFQKGWLPLADHIEFHIRIRSDWHKCHSKII